MKFFILLVAALTAIAIYTTPSQSEPGVIEFSEGGVSEFYTNDYRGVIVTDSRGFESQGTLSTFETTDRSARLEALRAFNAPAPAGPTVEAPAEPAVLKLDRAIYPERQRRPRLYETKPLP